MFCITPSSLKGLNQMSSQKKKDDLTGEPVGDSGLPKPPKAAIVLLQIFVTVGVIVVALQAYFQFHGSQAHAPEEERYWLAANTARLSKRRHCSIIRRFEPIWSGSTRGRVVERYLFCAHASHFRLSLGDCVKRYSEDHWCSHNFLL